MSPGHGFRLVATLVWCVFLAATRVQADVVIKMATIAPENSVWTRTLREMGDAWRRRTNGRVSLRLFPGTTGSEEKMLRDLRISKTLGAAQLSAIEMGTLDDGFNVFSLPMFFESYEEVDGVLAAVGPVLERRVEARGLKVLNWGYAGWVHVFSRTPVRTPGDLKKLKLFTSTGDGRMATWYRDNGFSPVPVDASQMLTGLTTGMIEAVPLTPLSAQLFMWYEHAPYMLDIGFAPLLGATVMRLDTWSQLASADQAIVLDEARRAGARLRTEVPRLDAEAVTRMKERKLVVTVGDQAVWRRTAADLGPVMRARLVPSDIYDLARKQRDGIRAQRSGAR